MDLIDALKTNRNIRQKGCILQHWMKPANIKCFSMEEVIADDWEVEPEVYEVECIIEKYKNGGLSMFVVTPFDGDGCGKLGDIVGKRIKATMEVLD